MKTLLALSGSSRNHSFNTLLLGKAEEIATSLNADVSVIDLGALNLPIYDGDLEASRGLPDGALDLKKAMQEADGFLIASPEYNSFPTPLLLNALDWASRPAEENEAPLSAFSGKIAGLMATSPGPMGGLRSLWSLRTFLQNVGVVVAPTLVAVGSASPELFAAEDFSDSANGKRLRTCIEQTLKLIV